MKEKRKWETGPLGTMTEQQNIEVDVIIPVHNACKTIVETVRSAMNQKLSSKLMGKEAWFKRTSVHVCCYDDGSTDNSWELLQGLVAEYQVSCESTIESNAFRSHLHIARGKLARGAGFARNRAAEMRNVTTSKEVDSDAAIYFLCLLDSDDIMHTNRISEQLHFMMTKVSPLDRKHLLVGTKFVRDPPDATWHYSEWANNLDDERLYLERYREVTLLQPTWFLCRSRFEEVGGYLEAPPDSSHNGGLHLADFIRTANSHLDNNVPEKQAPRLIHPKFEDFQTLRVAEDLRFFHEHLSMNGKLSLIRQPLVTYRHIHTSQSSKTSRKLLLHLRVLAFERSVIEVSDKWSRFCIWGAGRDGKDFFKALSEQARCRVVCFVDVDDKKFGVYCNRDLDVRIPVVHFALLSKDPTVRSDYLEGRTSGSTKFGRIIKGRKDSLDRKPSSSSEPPMQKKPRVQELLSSNVDLSELPTLPVVVCVAMYRTNGALEANVASINRSEGTDLWHFS